MPSDSVSGQVTLAPLPDRPRRRFRQRPLPAPSSSVRVVFLADDAPLQVGQCIPGLRDAMRYELWALAVGRITGGGVFMQSAGNTGRKNTRGSIGLQPRRPVEPAALTSPAFVHRPPGDLRSPDSRRTAPTTPLTVPPATTPEPSTGGTERGRAGDARGVSTARPEDRGARASRGSRAGAFWMSQHRLPITGAEVGPSPERSRTRYRSVRTDRRRGRRSGWFPCRTLDSALSIRWRPSRGSRRARQGPADDALVAGVDPS